MNKIWIVFKSEFINTVTRRSFILTLILVPLLPALILGGISLFGKGETDTGEVDMSQISMEGSMVEGYVDFADLIQTYPDWLQEDQLIAFDNIESARTATLAGDIQGFYVIDEDYLETGNIAYYRQDFNPFAAMEMSSGMMDALLQYNLLGADQRLFEVYTNPVQLAWVDLYPDETGMDDDSVASFYVPYGVTLLFYFLTFSSASLIMNSIAKEKENRVMEILMNAITPRELLTGKILALGFVGLLQLVVWMGSGLVLLRLGGTTLNIPAGLQLPPTLLFWGILFFITGYLIYAAIMAGVGALVPNIREASQATFMVIVPMLVPLFLASSIIEAPNTTLPIVLSLIPFTATTTMMTRLAVTAVPLWQLLTSLGLMVVTFILLIRAVARMFRTQLLLTGQKFTIGLFLKHLLGKGQTTIPEQTRS